MYIKRRIKDKKRREVEKQTTHMKKDKRRDEGPKRVKNEQLCCEVPVTAAESRLHREKREE